MSLSPSQRPTREWPLLILALALVGALCFPLWQGLAVDSSDGSNARLSFTPAKSGSYRVIVTAHPQANTTGEYTLTIRQTDMFAPLTDQDKQQVFTENLSTEDPLDRLVKKSPHKLHPVTLTSGQKYQFDLQSTEFNPVLRLENPAGKHLALDYDSGGGIFTGWTLARWGKLLIGPEQVVCYCCFAWACLILFSRYWEIRRQRRAFALNLLPTEEGTRILHEDARPLQRRVEQVLKDRGPFILVNMVRMALAKFIVGRASKDVSETVRIQAEVDQGRLASGLSTVNYLVWAIPAIGFLGTVRGLAGSLTMSTADSNISDAKFLQGATDNLNFAFDTTFIALLLSLGVMFLVHAVQREEENLVTDCQQYCTEHLVNRLYEPEAIDEGENEGGAIPHDFAAPPTSFASHGSRLSS